MNDNPVMKLIVWSNESVELPEELQTIDFTIKTFEGEKVDFYRYIAKSGEQRILVLEHGEFLVYKLP